MPPTAALEHGCENPLASTNHFHAGMAESLEGLIDCQRLRYPVVNCELARVWQAPRRSASIATATISSATI